MQFLVLRNILVATDLERADAPAMITGAQLANAAGAALHVACVVAVSDGDRDEDVQTRARTEMSEIVERAGASLNDVTIHVLSGDPALAIRSLSDRVRADVIVLGPHRARACLSRSFGGTAFAIVTNAWSPCLIVPTPLRFPLGHVLVPVDLSDTARGALFVGLSWASALRGGGTGDTRLTALHVQGASSTTPPPFLEKELAIVRATGGTWAGVSIDSETVFNSNDAEGIVSFSNRHRPDLVVLGTRGLGLDAVGRIGSVAASVMQSIDVPTLLVPPALWMAHASTHRGRQ
jgi:nucleotide-binding universal stress UspA family protein